MHIYTTVNYVKSDNFLGIVVDSNLTWKAYTDKFFSKIRFNLYIINRPSNKPKQM